jgi:TPR repeat protein
MSECRDAGFSMVGAALAAGLMIAIAGAALAEPLEDAVAAYARGDYTTAERLFRLPADQGVARAQFSLGVMYANGKGVPQDYAEAAKWYRKAADQGDALAQGRLGRMYFDGTGVPRDYVRAHMWANIAASSSHLDEEWRGFTVTLRDLIAARMTPSQISQAQTIAKRCIQTNYKDCG